MLNTCKYSPGMRRLGILIFGKKGNVKLYPVAKTMWSTSVNDVPSLKWMRPESGSKRMISFLIEMRGCVKGTHPTVGRGCLSEAYTGCFTTSLISWRTSIAEMDPPTTTTRCECF